jgi:hypothetical protein
LQEGAPAGVTCTGRARKGPVIACLDHFIVGALLAVRGTSILKFVQSSTLIGKNDERRVKSLNELVGEISDLMSDAYIPIAVTMWTEYAPQQANFRTELYAEFSQDSWAKEMGRKNLSYRSWHC